MSSTTQKQTRKWKNWRRQEVEKCWIRLGRQLSYFCRSRSVKQQFNAKKVTVETITVETGTTSKISWTNKPDTTAETYFNAHQNQESQEWQSLPDQFLKTGVKRQAKKFCGRKIRRQKVTLDLIPRPTLEESDKAAKQWKIRSRSVFETLKTFCEKN